MLVSAKAQEQVPNPPSYLEAHPISPLSNSPISQRRGNCSNNTRCPLLPRVQQEAGLKLSPLLLAIGETSASQTQNDHQAAKTSLNNSLTNNLVTLCLGLPKAQGLSSTQDLQRFHEESPSKPGLLATYECHQGPYISAPGRYLQESFLADP